MRANSGWRLMLLAGLGCLALALSFERAARAADADEELARKACDVLRAAGLDPSAIKTKNVERAELTEPMKAALTKAGLDYNAVAFALKKYPDCLTAASSAATTAPATKAPAASEGPAASAPPVNPGGGGGADFGRADGFGNKATGGEKEVRVNSVAQLASAVKQAGSKVVLAPGDYEVAGNQVVVGSNVTLDGGGATFWLPGTGHNASGVCLFGKNIILRNLRIRNAGDCVDLGGSAWTNRTSDVLIERVTVSGSGDDGFAPAYGATNITIRWSAVLGCTRAIFIKYGDPSDVTIHHTIISHFWMRAPLVVGSGTKCDFRNNLVQHWQMTGTQPSGGALVHCVNNTYRFDKGIDKGKGDCAIGTYQGGTFYSSGNEFVDCAERADGRSATPLFEAPPINGQTDARTALAAVLDETTGAGCMPRDAIDKAYLALKMGWPAQPSNKGITHGLQVPETETHLKGAK